MKVDFEVRQRCVTNEGDEEGRACVGAVLTVVLGGPH